MLLYQIFRNQTPVVGLVTAQTVTVWPSPLLHHLIYTVSISSQSSSIYVMVVVYTKNYLLRKQQVVWL